MKRSQGVESGSCADEIPSRITHVFAGKSDKLIESFCQICPMLYFFYIFVFLFNSSVLFAEGYGNYEFQNDSHLVVRAAAVKDSSETNFIVVGRMWTGVNYMAYIASLDNATGAVNQNFLGTSNSSPGRKLIDFAGATADNLCNAVTYAYDGYVAACRSLKSNGYYDIYLIKFDSNGNLDSSFGTNGIVTTGIGGSSANGQAFIRSITYNANANSGASHNGVVTIAGAVGAIGALHPYIASFDQQTGSQYGSTVKETGITGTAVSVEYNSSAGYYYMASTDTSATRHIYLHRYNDDLTASSSPWGTALDLSLSGAGTESVPSSLTVIGSNIIIAGSNKVASNTPPWRCMVVSVVKATRALNTSFGVVSGGSNNQGVTLFRENATRDCILNAVASPPSGSDILVVGTAYNGSNYDYMVGKMDNTGALDPGFNSTGYHMLSGGPADDVLNFALYLEGSTSNLYSGGRAQDQRLFNGITVNKTSTTSGTFTLETNRWTATTTTGAPSPRYYTKAVWTGTHMIVWGGASGTNLNSGGKYDPIANSWSSTSTNGAPSIRSGHTAIWTGSKMVIWGGYNGGSGFATGGQYDPSGNSWTATNTSGAPAGRLNHSAIWTGTKMIVWGGSAGNSGGQYDPSGNSWSATTTAGAPIGRTHHSAVWTASKMIVWGGIGVTNTGGVYDPTANTWTSTPTLNAPSPRYQHIAVGTGKRMLVWGGVSATSFNTGAQYDLTANAWYTISTNGAPSARYSHASVWTGSKLIVWGGVNSEGGVSNFGGQYDSNTDSWTAITTLGAPSSKITPHLLWTGSKVIVWGGSNSNTGGLYYPGTLNATANPAPVVSFESSSAAGINSSGTLTVSFSVTEANFVSLTAGDINFNTVSGNPSCTKTLTSSSPSRIVFTLSSCTGAGAFTTSIAAGVAQDLFANTSALSDDSATFTLENTKPTIAFATPSSTGPINSVSTTAIDVTFSESLDVLHYLQSSGVTVTTASGNATCLVSVTSDASNATITLSGCSGDGSVTVHVNAGAIADPSGNTNDQTSENPDPILISATPPLINFGSVSNNHINSSGTSNIPITYSKGLGVDTLTAMEVTLTTVSGTVSCSLALNYSDDSGAEVSASMCTGDGTFTIHVNAGAVVALDGNPNAQSSESILITVDNTAPSFVIGTPTPNTVDSTQSAFFALTFSESASTGSFDNSRIATSVTGDASCSAGVTHNSSTDSTVTFSSCTGNGTVSFHVSSGAISDIAGNVSGDSSESSSFAVTNVNPSPTPVVSLGSPSTSPMNSVGTSDIAVTYSETLGGDILQSSDVTLTQTGTVSCSVAVTSTSSSGATISITSCTGDGTVSAHVNGSSVANIAGVYNDPSAESASITIDNAGPTASLVVVGPTPLPQATMTSAGTGTIAVNYSETLGTHVLTDSDITTSLTGTASCSAVTVDSSNTSGAAINLSSCTGDGTITLHINSGTINDALGNTGSQSAESSPITIDNTGPVVNFGSPTAGSIDVNGSTTISLTYSESLGGGTSLDNGEVSTQYTGSAACSSVAVSNSTSSGAEVTLSGCSGNGTVSISVNAASFVDSWGNLNAGSGSSSSVDVIN